MKLLKDLMNIPSVSGNETIVRNLIYKTIKPYVDEIHIDRMGNVISVERGEKPRLMLAAHMDEIGLMVSGIDDKGVISCTAIGGIDPLTIIGERVSINTNGEVIHGIITTREISAAIDHRKMPTMRMIVVDTGMTKEELTKAGVRVGTYLSLERDTNYLSYGKKITGKAIDDRVGCYILIEVAKRIKKARSETYFVFTVEEEFGLYGAKTSAYTIEPDFGIAVDVTAANDLVERKNGEIKLGGGPVITIMDDRLISDRCLNEYLMEIAKKTKIPLQLEISEFGTTDASIISLSKGGVPSTVVSVPMRNLHTTVGIVHKRDIENAIRLLTELLLNPPVRCLI